MLTDAHLRRCSIRKPGLQQIYVRALLTTLVHKRRLLGMVVLRFYITVER